MTKTLGFTPNFMAEPGERLAGDERKAIIVGEALDASAALILYMDGRRYYIVEIDGNDVETFDSELYENPWREVICTESFKIATEVYFSELKSRQTQEFKLGYVPEPVPA